MIGEKHFQWRHEVRIGRASIAFEVFTHTMKRFGITLSFHAHLPQPLGCNQIQLAVAEPARGITERTYGGPGVPYYNPGVVALQLGLRNKIRFQGSYEFDDEQRELELS